MIKSITGGLYRDDRYTNSDVGCLLASSGARQGLWMGLINTLEPSFSIEGGEIPD